MGAGKIADIETDVLAVADQVDFYSLFKETNEYGGAALLHITQPFNFLSNTEMAEQHRRKLLELARQLAHDCKRPLYLSGTAPEDWLTHAAICLCDSIVIISRRNSMHEALKILSETILELIEIWPSLAPIWRKSLNQIIDGLDFSTATLLWEAQIKLRTME